MFQHLTCVDCPADTGGAIVEARGERGDKGEGGGVGRGTDTFCKKGG